MIDLGLLDEALKRVEKAYMNQRTPDALSVMKLMGAARAYRDLLANGERVEWCETHADKIMPHLSLKRCRWSMKVLADAAKKPCRIVSKFLVDQAIADARRTEEEE